ncbi:MAG: ribosome maturation factor RimP [Longibaculum sp.]
MFYGETLSFIFVNGGLYARKITSLIQPILSEHDVYLDDIEYVKEKNEWYLRIFIEKNVGHLDMDTCVAVSEAISDQLDEADIITNEYYLEVSSPGAEKPLKTLKRFNNLLENMFILNLRIQCLE